MKRRVTIADVAKLCGVTPATVSRVLNAKAKFSVSDAVRKKIVDTATKVGYVPDLAARNLNRQSTRIIGVFASPDAHVAEGIYESLLEGLAEVLHMGGYDVFFELSVARTRQEALPFWRFDGAALLQSPRPETVAELNQRRVPYVCINETVGSPAATVLVDDVMGMRRAFEHLTQLGHRRFAYANARAENLGHYSIPERHGTLTLLIKQGGMFLAPGSELRLTSATDFLRHAVVTHKATAVISYDHINAVMIVGAAHQLGLRIPQDFSLLCFNDIFPVELLGPPLTAVAVSGRDMGRTGASLLLNAIRHPDTPPPKSPLRIPEALVIRSSTATPPQPPRHG